METNGAPSRGVPILSGPPPLVEAHACRTCGRDFNPLWRRGKNCGHCGYEYCSNCMEGHALMPRTAVRQQARNSGPFTEIRDALMGALENPTTPGYDVEPLCTNCHGMMQVTAAPLATLRSLPIKRLKEYLKAYDIAAIGVTEKEDIVQAAFKARNAATGCLLPEHESYYRRRSVPKNGRLGDQPPPPPPYQPRSNAPRNRPPPAASRPQPSRQAPPPPRQAPQPQAPRPQARPPPPQPRPPQPRPQPPRDPPPPVPTILSLVPLPKSYLSSLSIGTLKAILYDNHVRVDFKQVLEKNELIDRVWELVVDERKRLERQRQMEEREAAEAEAAKRAQEDKVPTPEKEVSPTPADPLRPAPTGPAPEVERGLCVVCQDEEATLAVVDCGHLAMCQHCSDLIMATSRECPLCRTRIVTAHRLIRIYRV